MTLAIAVFTGCDRSGTPSPAPVPEKRHVLGIVYPLADIVRQIGGTRVDVDWFCENGEDPRDLKLTDAQIQRARRVELILTTGFRDLWAGDMLGETQRSLRLLRPEVMPTGRQFPDNHGALWLDPPIVKELVDEIRERLTVFDPKNDAQYRAVAERLAGEIDTFDADCRRTLDPLKGRKFLSLRPTWGPFVERYGLAEIAPIDVEPRNLTDEQVIVLKQASKEEGTDLLAIDVGFLPGVQRELQLRTGLRLLLLDPLGSSAPEGHSTWIKMMRYNLAQLEKGMARSD